MSPPFAFSLEAPSPVLIQLLDVLGIKHDGTFLDINKVAQEKFLRKPGKERWEMKSFHEDKRDLILPLIEKLGMIHAVYPSAKHYDYIIIHGSTVESMRERIKFLDTLWAQGMRGDQIVFFAGERPLDPTLESEANVFNQDFSSTKFRPGWQRKFPMPLTEAEAAPLLWDQVISNQDLRNMKVHYIRTSMKKDSKTGKELRPTTKDTVLTWLSTHPKAGTCLAISNNPYIPYQHQIVTNALEEEGGVDRGMVLETVGPAADSEDPIAVHLDNIARLIYAKINK